MKKIVLVLGLLAFLLSINVVSFANYSNDENEISGKEQMRKILEIKDKNGKIIIPGYVTGQGSTELGNEEEEWEKHELIFNRYHERSDVVREVIKNHKKNENEKSTAYSNLITKRVIFVTIFIILSATFIVLSFKLRNRKILLCEIPLLIICSILFFQNKVGNKINNNSNAIIDYLSGKTLNMKLDNFANEYKKNYLDKYNEREVDLSKVVNDYIIKCYYCVKRKANNKELYSSDLEVLNCFNDVVHNYDLTYGQKYLNISKWYNLDDWKVVNNLLSKESMKGIYDSITDEDIENFNKGTFLDKLIEKLDLIIKSNDEFDAYCVVPYGYFSIIRLDNKPLYYCKHWFLDKGQDISIELPYGAILKYDIAKFESKNIKEYLFAEVSELEYDPVNEKTLFLYYIDSNDKEQGVWTTVYNDSEYNKYELVDNIRLGHIDIYTNISIKNISDNYIENINFNVDKIIRKACIKRRKREVDCFTDNFIFKYGDEGVLNIENIDYIDTIQNITFDFIDEDKREINKYLCDIKFLSSKGHKYAIFYIIWKGDKVDDIEYYIIPEDKMNLSYEEMYQLAFND